MNTHPTVNFEESVRPSTESREKIINYVWVRKDVFQPDLKNPKSHLCGVPLEDVDKALENCKKYPNAQFIIWLDFDELDDLSLYFVNHHIYSAGVKNAVVKNLRDIPEYSSSPAFTIPHEIDVYPRADFARLLTVAHMMDKSPNANVFYSDFDVDDVFIEDASISVYLSSQGAVFTHTFDDPIENGYMAFYGAKGLETLRHVIKETKVNALCNEKGYEPLMVTINRIYGSVDPVVCDLPILKERGYEIPKPKIYAEFGIC